MMGRSRRRRKRRRARTDWSCGLSFLYHNAFHCARRVGCSYWRNGGKDPGSRLFSLFGWFLMAMALQMVLLGCIKEFSTPSLHVLRLHIDICGTVRVCIAPV